MALLTEIIVGIAISALLEAFINTGLVSPSYILLIRLAGVITLIFVFFVPVFRTSYTIGWLLGLALMSSSGLAKPYDYLLYLIPLIIGWLLGHAFKLIYKVWDLHNKCFNL